MILFKVSLNGKELCTAGAEDLGVLSAILSASGKLGSNTAAHDGREPDIYFRVGGLTSRADGKDEHPNWVDFIDLKPGDSVNIEVKEADQADNPVSANPHCKERAREKQREEWEYAKEYYFQFKEEFEDESK